MWLNTCMNVAKPFYGQFNLRQLPVSPILNHFPPSISLKHTLPRHPAFKCFACCKIAKRFPNGSAVLRNPTLEWPKGADVHPEV
jgi:hypothetical protein